MKVINSLAFKYVLKNKKKSLSIILGIMVVTILVVTAITFLSSYQQYLAESIRNKKNWEISIKNIPYADTYKIMENKNIKEMSITI